MHVCIITITSTSQLDIKIQPQAKKILLWPVHAVLLFP